HDRFEQEADRVADQVMRMADPLRPGAIDLVGGASPDGIQRLCAECKDEVRRRPIEEEDQELQMKRAPGATAELGPGVQTQISALRGGGQPLAPALRGFFEPRFGHDFSQVHIHQGSQASEAARAIGARAYTLGRDLVFGQGQYRPGSDRGRRLIAHELTHVVQQTGVDRAFVQRQGSAELSTTEGQLLPAPPPASIGHGPENRIAGLCPVLAEGTLSEVSWGESASMYPTKDMAPTKEALYYPENWDQAKNCELLKARGAMDLISQRNPDVQRGTPSPKDVIHQRVKKYHFIENFPSPDPEVADPEVKWFFHDPSPTAVHTGIDRETQQRVKTYGPFYNSFEGKVPKGPVHVLFYKQKSP
ncbi:MAG: DUF4157 domain-containing protein, partial [Geminicoccaceae bacterium]